MLQATGAEKLCPFFLQAINGCKGEIGKETPLSQGLVRLA
jgi:hypothetical protein